MRFMLLMRPNIDQTDEGWAPPAEAVAVFPVTWVQPVSDTV